MKRTNRRLTKLENHNLQQKFKTDFSTGKYELTELAERYNVGRRKLQAWKKQMFGLGSIKQAVAYKMHLAGLPTTTIADYLNTHRFVIHKYIRNARKISREVQGEK